MSATRSQAIARALASRSYPRGMCYRWTREMFGLPAVGDVDRDGDADAVDGWKAAKRWHLLDRKPPAGVPVFWSGGSAGHGHAAITVPGGVRSIDVGPTGFGSVGTVPLDWFERHWGLTYLGWSEDLGGVTIPTDPQPAAPAKRRPAYVRAARKAIALARKAAGPVQRRKLDRADAELRKIRPR
ncbi:hypothetical protein [Pimelobacter simplex]|uniref:hypothetical protein n=1 Tax=Nocardioides simplex TaxID=2045 RepID=UPI00214F729C|nr:hypothetical protein [Pimelobacter simplex]UUW92666.1 hypothetical protein M0M43_14640 [Pimelobacter simplex]UUW96494.1 hypothetical protein M0M48_03275 [Pimelobacter simplex]